MIFILVCEIIKTAIENKQDLIVEGCYIPYDWRKDFGKEYLSQIRFICLVMTDAYIDEHFADIIDHGSEIEARLDDSDCTPDWIKEENRKTGEGFEGAGEEIVLINGDYEESLRCVLG